MLILIGELNGQKIEIPVTADTGAGAPVGSYLYLEKKSDPQGYLFCDGTRFDPTKYPALYQYLGTDVLPDWRELGAKGAEKNTTLIFDSTETDPTTGQAGTQNHDVFTQGEFKDDQLQNHYHRIDSYENGSTAFSTHVLVKPNTGLGNQNVTDTGLLYNARIGDVTRGKSRAVYIYIKATSGLTENQQENVLNTINQNLSYSTTEHKTGKKWIDGKDIWSCVFPCSTHFAIVANTWTSDIKNNFTGLATVYPNIDTITLIRINRSKKDVIEGFLTKEENGQFQLSTYTGWDIIVGSGYITLEYTKTTD